MLQTLQFKAIIIWRIISEIIIYSTQMCNLPFQGRGYISFLHIISINKTFHSVTSKLWCFLTHTYRFFIYWKVPFLIYFWRQKKDCTWKFHIFFLTSFQSFHNKIFTLCSFDHNYNLLNANKIHLLLNYMYYFKIRNLENNIHCILHSCLLFLSCFMNLDYIYKNILNECIF